MFDCSDPVDCSLPGSSVHGIFQAEVLEWGAIAFSWGHALLLLLLSRFSHVDSVRPHRQQPTRLPIPGILQARKLEWIAISFSNA